jgi:hypothetical protein
MNLQMMPVHEANSRSVTIDDELEGARDDLARLSALLNEAFAELLASFSAIQAAAQNGSGNAAIDQHTMRAVTALQCEDMASQLITFTQKRLESARGVLKNLPEMPQTALTDAVWAAGLAACSDLPAATRGGSHRGGSHASAPVRQDGMGAGDIDLF